VLTVALQITKPDIGFEHGVLKVGRVATFPVESIVKIGILTPQIVIFILKLGKEGQNVLTARTLGHGIQIDLLFFLGQEFQL
jgi:hypothetical protein